MRLEGPRDVVPSAFTWLTLDPSEGSGTQWVRALTLSLGSCSLTVDRNAASELWDVLRDLLAKSEILSCPDIFQELLSGWLCPRQKELVPRTS